MKLVLEKHVERAEAIKFNGKNLAEIKEFIASNIDLTGDELTEHIDDVLSEVNFSEGDYFIRTSEGKFDLVTDEKLLLKEYRVLKHVPHDLDPKEEGDE